MSEITVSTARTSRRTFARAALSVAIVVAGLPALALCAVPTANCAHRATSGAEAVQGLIHAVRTATKPADVCAWVTADPNVVVTSKDVERLRNGIAQYTESDLKIEPDEQMGSTQLVSVGTRGGAAVDSFVTSDERGKGFWTVSFGSPR